MSRHKKILISLTLLVLGGFMFYPKTAHAQSYNDIYAQVIPHAPSYLATYVADRCVNAGWSVVQEQWVSAQGEPTSVSASVNYGAVSVNLQLNYLTYRCKEGSGVVLGSFEITNTETWFSPNIPQLNGVIGDMPYGGVGHLNTGNVKNFAFPLGGITQTQDIVVAFESRGTLTNLFGASNCAIWEDGQYSGPVDHKHDFVPCATGWSTFLIRVNVSEQPPPGGGGPSQPVVTTSCSGSTSTASVSWSGAPGNTSSGLGFWLDVDNDNNWENGYIHARFVTSSPASLPPPTLTGGSTYYVRIGNGTVHSPTRQFTARSCPTSTPSPPTVDLQVNGSDSPGPIERGEAITVSWTTTDSPTSCTASDTWAGYSPSPSGGSVSRTSDSTTEGTKTYSIRCSNSGGEDTDSVNIRVGRKPYLRVFGGDVLAGSGFGPSCSPGSATIQAYNRGSGGAWGGAGTQFAALAPGSIIDFSSAQQRSSGQPKSLSFANTTGTYGGNFGNPICGLDYVGNAAQTGTPLTSGTIGGTNQIPADAGGGIYNAIPNRRNIVLRRTGNVYINGSVQYQNTNWTSRTDIPSFYLIVEGNIYIDNDVTQLDGVYIATGTIYTCSTNGSAPVSAANLYTNCSTKLTVNGAFIADQVKFLRTNGTRRDAGSPNTEGASSNNIAEAFIYGPELWLVNPRLYPASGFKYDSITSLPPVL